MTHYLSEIKMVVDNIAAAGSTVDVEDIIIYILNGLPPTYQSLKSAIRTRPESISLYDLYTLLLSEEVNLSTELAKDSGNTQMALYSQPINRSGFRSRGRGRGRPVQPSPNTPSVGPYPPIPQCQICQKSGHLALKCWHHNNLQYIPTTNTCQAMYSATTGNQSDWILDTGASSHLTNDIHNLHHPEPYHGSDRIQIGDGSTVPITHSGTRILPTPTRKLHLSILLYSPQLSHNLISVRQLAEDNNCDVSFSATGYQLQDKNNHRILSSGPSINDTYPLTQHFALHSTIHNISTWHRRLGHPHADALQQILPHIIGSTTKNTPISCNSCKASKSHRLPFSPSVTMAHGHLA